MSNPPLQHLFGEAQQACDAGRFEQARTLCEQMLAKDKRNGAVLYLMGRVLKAEARFDEAARYLERCTQLRPDEANAHLMLGTVQISRGKYQAALKCFDRVLKKHPGNVHAIHGKAETFQHTDDLRRLRDLLAPFIEAGTEDATMGYAYAAWLEKNDGSDEAVALLRKHAAAPTSEPPIRSLLNFRLGKLLERLGSYDDSFAAYEAANRDLGGIDDPAAYAKRIDDLIEIFSVGRMPRLARADHGLDVPVLVVGMPRTGSTLVERIIEAHPEAIGAGETTALVDVVSTLALKIGSTQPFPACVRALLTGTANEAGTHYVERLRETSRTARRIVDKHLPNYELLGLIAMIVPEARIIDCRRNPLDNCLSCFTEPLAITGHPYACDLASLGRRYREYERIMDHWHRVLDANILRVDYETLVADQEDVSRTIIDFIGLPWNPACLRFHESKRAVLTLSREQVNRPIYRTSVDRAQRFAAYLEPLRRELGHRHGAR